MESNPPPAFNWRQQWYPLVPVSYLSQTKPLAVTVLGRQLAVWFHAPRQAWQAVEDRCPHRLAPLSEGRIEPQSGNLECSYHGWQFGPGGRCAAIPQADSPEQAAFACGNLRSCLASFPVREQAGMLWVWMDPHPASAPLRQLRPLPMPAELAAAEAAPGGRAKPSVMLGSWYQRELPLSAEYLLENLLDPAHVNFAHHGVIGRRTSAASIDLQPEGPVTAQGGFTVRMSTEWGGGGGALPAGGSMDLSARVRFVPPGLVWQEFAAGGARFSMLFYVVPVAPGRSRFFAGYSTDVLPPAVTGLLAPLEPLLHSLQFLADLSAHEVIDGDAIHIAHQEQTALREGRSWRHSYFMPTSSDRAVVLLRRWLDDFAGGVPAYRPPPTSTNGQPQAQAQPGAGLPLTRRQILDRYEQHTRHCPSCRRAYAVVRTTRQALQAGAASGFALAFALAAAQALSPPPRLAPTSLPLLLGTAALTAGAAQQLLGRLEQRFVFVDYVHSEK